MRASALAACAAAGLVLAGAATAQSFPTKPIRVINPASPGGNSDIAKRPESSAVTVAR